MSIVDALLGTSPEGQDRRLNILLGIATLTALIVVIGGAVAGPKILTNASTTEAVKRNGDIASCRSRYFADTQLVLSDLQGDRARLDVATSAGLTAVASDDDAGLLRAVTDSAEYRLDVLESAAELAKVTATYDGMVALSDDDPERFLDLCNDRDGGALP